MICPKCKKLYGDDNIYCVDCGTRLVDDDSLNMEGTPIERFSNRVKTSSSKSQIDGTFQRGPKKVKQVSMSDHKLDVIILQNKELINQNKRIIELLEKLTS